jgi:thiol:disulfide interchange protein
MNRGIWWVLLVVPLCMGLGWAVAQLPGPKPRPPKVAAQQTAIEEASEAESPVASATKPSGGAPEAQQLHPAPSTAQKPAEKPTTSSLSGTYSQWMTLDAAMIESQRTGKPILIDFSAEWCGPCRAMKAQVFDEMMNGRAVQTAVVPVSIVDRTREDGNNPAEIDDLQQKYSVDAFPTLVVFSPKTGRVMRTQGYGGAQRTIDWINAAVEAVR